MSREPVTTPEDLASLDLAEVLEGYRDGRAGEPEPGDNRSRSYRHGFLNGQVDAGLAKKSQAQAELARIYVAAQRQRP